MKTRTEQIKIVCQKLYRLWKAHSRLRLGQVLTIISADLKKELWDIKDKEFLMAIVEEINK